MHNVISSRSSHTQRLELNPGFNQKIKVYYSEVPFDVVTLTVRRELLRVSARYCTCRGGQDQGMRMLIGAEGDILAGKQTLETTFEDGSEDLRHSLLEDCQGEILLLHRYHVVKITQVL